MKWRAIFSSISGGRWMVFVERFSFFSVNLGRALRSHTWPNRFRCGWVCMFDRIYNFIGFIRNSWVYTTLVGNPRRLYPLPNVFKTIFDCFDMSPMQQTIALINRRPERTGSTESESHNDLTWLMSCYNRLPSFHFFSFHFDAFDVHVIHALSIHSACVCASSLSKWSENSNENHPQEKCRSSVCAMCGVS